MNFLSKVSISTVALTMALGLAGCDQSKEQLDQTKEQLSKVTTDKAALQAQLDTMKVSMDAMKSENEANKVKMADADAKLAACAPGAVPPPAAEPVKAGGKSHAAAKPKPGVAPPAPAVDTAAPVGARTNPVVVPQKRGSEY